MDRPLAITTLALLCAAGCGARTAPNEPSGPSASRDAGVRFDASTLDASSPSRDAGRDAGACDEIDRDRDGVSTCAGDCDDGDPAVFPAAAEVCDGRDQNCDGVADEGVLSECGDCRPGCRRETRPDATGWMPTPETSAGVEVDPDGALVLSATRAETYFAWIADYVRGTITKLDTRDGSQSASYDSVLLDGVNHAAAPGETCEVRRAGGNCPSRTAVDLHGAVYIANRAFFGQGTVTKIAGFEEDCVDRNGNGRIDTSHDVDGDGIVERGVAGEFLGQDDECIVWTVDVGPVDGIPRAIAVAPDGSVWVGLHGAREVIQLDASTGRLLRTVNLSGRRFQPYGAAVDSTGRLWLAEVFTGRIISIDTATGTLGPVRTATASDGCVSSYGIAIDHRDRVWLAGMQCHWAYRYDPVSNSWFNMPLPDSGVGRGIAADASGRIYVAASHLSIAFAPGFPGGYYVSEPIARLTIFDSDGGSAVRVFDVPGLASIGVGLDSMGRAWLVNQESGTATRVDPETGEAREFAAGTSLYTYSDFTGYALRTFVAPSGYARTTFEGCAVGPTEWETITWDADAPAGSRVSVRVRSADLVAGLPSAPWIGPFAAMPAILAGPPGPVAPRRYLEVEVSLVSDDSAHSPAVRTVTVQLNCPL